jgi:hypothetical protein
LHPNLTNLIEISAKSGKEQHQYPEFDHKQGVGSKKNLPNSTLAFKGVEKGGTQKTVNFDGFLSFTLFLLS